MTETTRVRTSMMRSPQWLVLDEYAKKRASNPDQARAGLTVTTSDDGPSYMVWVLGIVRESRYLIVTAPTTTEGSLIAVIKGQALTCRWFNPSTAFRFRATILKLSFEPIPVLYLELPRAIERRIVRRVPRASVNLHGILKIPAPTEVLAVDLSATGARIAAIAPLALQPGQPVEFVTKITVLDKDYLLQLSATVASAAGAADPDNPHLEFYGLDFTHVPQFDLILLHAYVQERLANDADWLSRVLEMQT